ncbi:glycoside hydrolase family 3 N-terminal domain-containing protein [Spirulina sp. 06S082]|uniref:glycoside hydrolase family 3 N-terminal domain-containing protein n=1 Tax=Spirulina sp. 06S082 TaxID=3110248 RepID=UPI002B1F60BD|nr:glycoside hydrolase family 3 N-terminal domain-containing protein [Spirulina sp. 06S082]MEA5471854.1 glycoside hydrolase family 3 N-terminal domain-containing protein [Spirulina sp. 06S082]
MKNEIGQMLVVRASGHLFDQQIRYPVWEATQQQLQYWLADLNIGGVILLGGSVVELAARSRQLQNWAKTPLLIAADIEEGVGQRFPGGTWFPPPMALSAIGDRKTAQQCAAEMGKTTAREALAAGINWLLAPVVDVNNNPDNPVINVRAFGDTPEAVTELATAFITGCQHYPVLTTAKHFPGHGDTATDSHLELPAIAHSEKRLHEVELPPFIGAIAAGVDSVMTAHLRVLAWDKETPATLSYPILTEQLRQKMGFEGLIVTDALVMAGVANYADAEEICLQAIEAGADILLMPANPEKAIAAIENAVKTGRISRDRLRASLHRIRTAKEKISANALARSPQKQDAAIALSFDPSQFAQIRDGATVETILRESMQQGGNLPLQPPQTPHQGINAIVASNLLNNDFLGFHTPAIAIPQQLGYELQLLAPESLQQLLSFSSMTLQLFARGNPFRGSASFTPETKSVLENLLRSDRVTALVLYGSPYIVEWLLPNLNSHIPWVFSYGQMPTAQRLAWEFLLSQKTLSSVRQNAFI